MIYRIILVALIAFVVLGTSAIVYDYSIDVRGVEARVLTKQIVNCLEPDGKLVNIPVEFENKILDFCKIKNTGRFYVQINLTGDKNEIIKKYEQGDSGSLWIKEMFDSSKDATVNIKKYESGDFFGIYDVYYNGNKIKLYTMVLVNHEL